ncbi:hypothetical protein [Pseudonocardia sp. GCM10023141]|uniref:hypothetical protein n=1 Tax=Pseudonocardia sp. GCM10023141 TaxID=3252653 RepID=UPI003607A76E
MHTDPAWIVQAAAPFVWWGAVLAISFLEAPLKFRAPGITRELGLGIGRLVFRALNIAEVVLAAALTVAVLAGPPGTPTLATTTLLALWVLLVVQLAILRPRLTRRTRALLAGAVSPPSRLHLAYIALEGVKAVLLPVLGIALLARG